MIRKCGLEECGIEYQAATHNQKYCCNEHLKIATNRRTMTKYHEDKARKQGTVRTCSVKGCGTVLSRYNLHRVCSKCEAERNASAKSRLMRILEQ